MSSLIKNEIQRIASVVDMQFQARIMPNLTDEVKGCMTGVHFLWGHPLEIVETLQGYTAHDTLKYEKFPLIALYTDIPVDKQGAGDYDVAVLRIIIANSTERNLTSPERENINFLPILYPIYQLFLHELNLSNVFSMVDDTQDLQHRVTERYYWGKQGLYGNVGNVFNDFVDAIEIENLRLKINISCNRI